MAAWLTTACSGLVTNPNDVGQQVPDGALARADNVVVSRDGIIEPRRGFTTWGTPYPGTSVPKTARLGSFRGQLVGAFGTSDEHNIDTSADGSSWTTLLSMPTSARRFVEASGNLYVATSYAGKPKGVQRLEALSAAHAWSAGIAPGRGCIVQAAAGGSTIPNNKAVAYRSVWTYTDGSNNKHVGAPSSSAIYVNVSGGTMDAFVLSPIPSDLPAGAVCEFYRTATVDSANDPGDDMAQIGTRTAPSSATATAFSRTSNIVTVTTSAAHGFATGDGISTGSGTVTGGVGTGVFARGTEVVLSAPTPTTFTYASGAADGTKTGVSVTVNPLAVGIKDLVADGLRGAALYTNPTEGTSIAAQYPPPGALDVAAFRDCVFYANTRDVHRLNTTLMAVDATGNGLRSGDTVTVGGVVFTASGVTGTIPDAATNTFQISPSADATVRARDTAIELVNAINIYGSGRPAIGAVKLTVDQPGAIQIFQATPGASQITFATSRPSAFIGDAVSTEDELVNALYWSEQGKPDAVPLTNYVQIGSETEPIQRIVPLRDSLIILKTDGVWRLTGDSPSTFRIDPLDLTADCLAPESAVALENTVFCLSQHGVVRISDTGVTVVSRQIEDQILPLLTSTMRPVTKALAHAVAYEADHKYLLWMPSAAGDTYATQAFVYDFFTETWTRWTKPARCGYVLDDVAYLGSAAAGAAVLKERKSLTTADYADEAIAAVATDTGPASIKLDGPYDVAAGDRVVQGAATAIVTASDGVTLALDRVAAFIAGALTVYKAFPVAVRWTPRFGDGDPGAMMHAREAQFFFRSVYFATATASFKTDLSPAGSSLALGGSALGLVDPPTGPRNVRMLIPRGEQRGSRLTVELAVTQAQSAFQLQGVKVLYEGGSERTSR